MLAALMVCLAAWPGDSVASGRDVIRLMHDRYAATWFETLAAIQTATYFDSAGGVDHAELWYESFSLPGTLRSDAAPLARGSGELVRNDSLYRFERDSVVHRAAAIHLILLLGFDVYRESVESTLEKLERFGVAVDSVREEEWDGRRIWVVGSPDGPRFWVDAPDLLLRRLIVPGEAGAPGLEVQFDDYRQVGGGWLATERRFLTGGAVRIREQDVWWKAGVPLPAQLFVPTSRGRLTWVHD